jgi:hypothetical protein
VRRRCQGVCGRRAAANVGLLFSWYDVPAFRPGVFRHHSDEKSPESTYFRLRTAKKTLRRQKTPTIDLATWRAGKIRA